MGIGKKIILYEDFYTFQSTSLDNLRTSNGPLNHYPPNTMNLKPHKAIHPLVSVFH